MTKDQGKLANQLIFTDAARSLRKGYLNIGRVIRDVNKVEESMHNDEDGETMLESIKNMAANSAKKDALIDKLVAKVDTLTESIARGAK